MTLAELLKSLAEKVKALDTLQTKAFADDATEDNTKDLDAALDDIKSLKSKIEKAKEIDALQKAQATPADDPVSQTGTKSTPARVVKDIDAQTKLGLAIGAIVAGHNQKTTPQVALEKAGYANIMKDLISTVDADGGYTVPTNLSNQIIEILREDSAFLAGGPRRIGLPNGNITIPAGDTGVSGGYGAEASNIIVESQTFRDVQLNAKRLSVLVPVSNELLAWSLIDMQSFINSDIRAGLGENMDLSLLRGDGVGSNPLGITKIAGLGSVAIVGSTIPQISQTLGLAETLMRNKKVKGRKAVWIMAPRTLIFLKNLRTDLGGFAFPTLHNATPTLNDKRVLDTTQVPINLGVGTNESEIALIDFDHVLFGEASGLSFAVSTEAPYDTGSGMKSAFQNNSTLIRAITHHDADIRQMGAVVNVTGVTWGASL